MSQFYQGKSLKSNAFWSNYDDFEHQIKKMDQKLLILLKWHIPYVPDTRGPTSRGTFGTFPSETFDTSRPGGTISQKLRTNASLQV